VIAIDEINVGVTGRPEQDGGAGGVAGGGVGGGIVFAEISLHLNDAARQVELSVVTHQDFPQQFASDAAWTAGEE